MKVQLISPVAALHGKLNGKAKLYFKTVNGKTFVQRCPSRTAPPTRNQLAARKRFSAIAQYVAKMKEEGSTLSTKQLWQLAAKTL